MRSSLPIGLKSHSNHSGVSGKWLHASRPQDSIAGPVQWNSHLPFDTATGGTGAGKCEQWHDFHAARSVAVSTLTYSSNYVVTQASSAVRRVQAGVPAASNGINLESANDHRLRTRPARARTSGRQQRDAERSAGSARKRIRSLHCPSFASRDPVPDISASNAARLQTNCCSALPPRHALPRNVFLAMIKTVRYTLQLARAEGARAVIFLLSRSPYCTHCAC